jgi:hypothetical protein
MWDINRVLESQGDAHTKVKIQSNSELQSLTSSPTRSVGPSCFQIDAHDAYNLQFGHSTYAWKSKEISFLNPPVSWLTKIVLTYNSRKRLISRSFLELHHLFWVDGPSIELESVRDVFIDDQIWQV